MVSDEQKRELVKQAHPNPNWAERVDGMANKQVAAIYLRLLDQNKIKVKERR